LALDGIAAHPAHQQQTKASIPAAAVAAPLLLAALVVGGAAGKVLWRRKLRRDSVQWQQRCGEDRPLRQHARPSVEHAHATRGLPVMVGGFEGAHRRADLAAVLQSKLGNNHGIEMLPLEAFPTRVAHRLGARIGQSLDSTSNSWSSQPSSRQRILGTQSLQLAPGELEVVRLRFASAHLPHLP
jgi:hypothetical protein